MCYQKLNYLFIISRVFDSYSYYYYWINFFKRFNMLTVFVIDYTEIENYFSTLLFLF